MPKHSAGVAITRRDSRPTSADADMVATRGSAPLTGGAGVSAYTAEGGAQSSETGQILLVHPGGPFWANKDEHGWSVPKGEFDPETEDALECARREFEEELGQRVPEGELIELGAFTASGKAVHVWLLEADLDVSEIQSNEFTMEWPRGSGNMQAFPEIDKAEWFSLDIARTKIHKGQVQIVDAVEAWLAMNSPKVDK